MGSGHMALHQQAEDNAILGPDNCIIFQKNHDPPAYF